MFDALTDRLGEIFDRLRRRGALSESDVAAALRELRIALLEADVALPVVKKLVEDVSHKAVGAEILRSVTPGQMVVKLVHDHLVEMLGGSAVDLNLAAAPPAAIMLVGLQGSGKTTTTAKIGRQLQERDKKKVLMASLDVARPAAQEQLRTLGEQAGVATLPIIAGQQPVDIARRALQAGRLGGYDIVLLDTAGRLHVDEQLMDEMTAVRDATAPVETLLVADAMTGQDAVNVAEGFHGRVGLTGIVLTRVDGDARGGAALSMRAVTGQPIKLIGVGEGLDALEAFHPERVANRILGMGDVVGLVEKAAETIEQEEAEKLAKKMQKGSLDLDDLALQLRQMRKMGGLTGVMSMLPGISKVQKQMAEARIDDREIRRQEAIISSMTPKERKSPKIIQASRKRRIAAGSGTTVSEVNKLLKQHLMMVKVMKKMGKMGKKGLMRQGLPGMPGLPGGPQMPS
ncbi:MAG: signal recognition particle protein [Rhodospirillales bacterium]|nr:MAG: signal recognition particle protein [Rhodospirillales bacterium]